MPSQGIICPFVRPILPVMGESSFGMLDMYCLYIDYKFNFFPLILIIFSLLE